MTGSIQLGMSRAELRSTAGPPVRVVEAPAGKEEMWLYRRPGQRLLRLRTTWIEFEFRDGALVGNRTYTDSIRAVVGWYAKALLLAVAAVGILTISQIATGRYEGQRIRAGREVLRPGLTTEEVALLFTRRGSSAPSPDGTESWTVKGRSVDRLFGDLYLIDGTFVRQPENTQTDLWIDFKNGEVVAWNEVVSP